MTDKYLISSVQLGMILGGVHIIESNENYDEKAINLIKETIQNIMKEYHVGYFESNINKDIKLIKEFLKEQKILKLAKGE